MFLPRRPAAVRVSPAGRLGLPLPPEIIDEAVDAARTIGSLAGQADERREPDGQSRPRPLPPSAAPVSVPPRASCLGHDMVLLRLCAGCDRARAVPSDTPRRAPHPEASEFEAEMGL